MKTIEGKQVYSVQEANSLARRALEQINLWVEGELSSFKGYQTKYRYIYFDLKDPQTSYKIPCIIEPEIITLETNQFEDGMKVLVQGALTLWEKEGKYQMYVFSIQQFGEGNLLAEFEKLKLKLAQKGYFDTKFKKELPLYPTKVSVITSQRSNAWQDFLKHSHLRFPLIKITLFDVMVQGEASSGQIIEAVNKADKLKFDLIVLIRGGGSLEDLAVFNNEALAAAIFRAKTPILTGIGHEKDITIAGLVADFAASTPTDAAKVITENFMKLEQKLFHLHMRINGYYKNIFLSKFQLLDVLYQKLTSTKEKSLALLQTIGFLRKSIIVSFENLAKSYQQGLKSLKLQIESEWETINTREESKLKYLKEKMMILSPKNILKRGFSVTTNTKGTIIKDSALVDIGEKLKVKLSRGRLISKVLLKEADV